MRRVVLAITASLTLTLSLSGIALATPADYNPPPTVSECGAYHGAFEYYSHMSGYWIPGAAQQGGIGDTTGPANSAKGCQSHF
jgi:hypothetical protein